MNSRSRQVLLVSLLALIALASAFDVYLSISLGHMMRDLLRGVGFRAGSPSLAWDDWFFGAVSAMSVLAIIGVLLQKSWGKLLSLIVLGAGFGWAIAMTTVPQNHLENWFSTSVDRLPAALISLAMLLAMVRLDSTEVRSRIQGTRVAQ
jgi:hypothetical protein